MAKKQILENEQNLEDQVVGDEETGEEVEVDESAASETLHPGAGSHAGTMPRAEVAAKIMGALANADREKLTRFWKETLSTHFGTDFGAHDRSENAPTIVAHPSDAVGKAVKEDIAEMFQGQELSEDFKTKATVIFEAAIQAKVNEALVEAEDAYDQRLEEEVAEISEAVLDKVQVFLEYIAEQWMEENAIAVESSLRNEITTDFMGKLRDLFIESNVNIPEDQVEVIDALAKKVDELESRLAEVVQENAELREGQEAVEKADIVDSFKDGMTDVEAEKLDKLAEGVEAESAEEFTAKVKILAESVKPNGTKSKVGANVQELLEEVSEDNKVLINEDGKVVTEETSPEMARYLNAIKRTVPAKEKVA